MLRSNSTCLIDPLYSSSRVHSSVTSMSFGASLFAIPYPPMLSAKKLGLTSVPSIALESDKMSAPLKCFSKKLSEFIFMK